MTRSATALLALLCAAAVLAGGLAGVRAEPRSPAGPPAAGTGFVSATKPPLGRAIPLSLSAALTGDQRPLASGLAWRVFADDASPDADAATKPVARSSDAAPTFTLEPGAYIVHVTYGFASAMKRVVLGNPTTERLTIGAGALQISGVIADTPIPPAKLSFAVYVPMGQNPEGRLVIENAHPGDLIRLPEGTYHVVSTYGDSNAIMRADLKVDAGKVTEATLNHRAATVTLKLVRAAGGEAFAGTAFSVLTPGGDVIREAIGAFPSLILAEGDYVVIARHEGQVYTREFKVVSGLDRDIEVIAKVGGNSQ